MNGRLAELGFSDYESKIWLALLQVHPATAYEAAREAGIPTSKVYEVLDRLAQRGLVRFVETEGKKRYIPQPPDEFIEATRERVTRTLDALKVELANLDRPQEVSYVWNLTDYHVLVNKAARMIRDAHDRVLVSAWGDEARLLAPLLTEAQRRGVRSALVLFGHEPIDAPNVFLHPIEDTIYQEHGGRGLVVIADGHEALMGTVHEDSPGRPPVVEGAWSLNRGFVTLAEDYVKHDVYIMKIVRRMDADLVRRFGVNYTLLRDIFSDRELDPEEDSHE